MIVATLPDGATVTLDPATASMLRFPPPSMHLTVAVHSGALRAPKDRHTQVVHLQAGSVDWVGALGEDRLTLTGQGSPARAILGGYLFNSPRAWKIVKPGSLLKSGVPSPQSTIYAGSPLRPWVVLGQTAAGKLICAPLNNATGNPKWWAPVLRKSDMSFAGNNKDGQIELAHLWTLPDSVDTVGRVESSATANLEEAISNYFR